MDVSERRIPYVAVIACALTLANTATLACQFAGVDAVQPEPTATVRRAMDDPKSHTAEKLLVWSGGVLAPRTGWEGKRVSSHDPQRFSNDLAKRTLGGHLRVHANFARAQAAGMARHPIALQSRRAQGRSLDPGDRECKRFAALVIR
jgi:hypothetical protein